MINQIKKSLILSGHKTSVALEKEFWEALEFIANKNKISIDAVSYTHLTLPTKA